MYLTAGFLFYWFCLLVALFEDCASGLKIACFVWDWCNIEFVPFVFCVYGSVCNLISWLPGGWVCCLSGIWVLMFVFCTLGLCFVVWVFGF